jgi:hypothetical protein
MDDELDRKHSGSLEPTPSESACFTCDEIFEYIDMLIFQRGWPLPKFWSNSQFQKNFKKLGITGVTKFGEEPDWPPVLSNTIRNLQETWVSFGTLRIPDPPAGEVQLKSDYNNSSTDNLDWTKDGEGVHVMTGLQIR